MYASLFRKVMSKIFDLLKSNCCFTTDCGNCFRLIFILSDEMLSIYILLHKFTAEVDTWDLAGAVLKICGGLKIHAPGAAQILSPAFANS